MKDSLKVEKSQFEKNDKIYRKLFLNNPHRVDYNKYPEIQRADIDLVIKNRQGNPVRISEKYRKVDYGDILFEVYSVFPNDRGWAMGSKADILAYWFPTRVVIIDMKKVVEVFEKNEVTKKIHLIETSKALHSMILNGKTFYPYIIRADNKGYSTLSITLKFEDLDKLGIKYSVIQLG